MTNFFLITSYFNNKKLSFSGPKIVSTCDTKCHTTLSHDESKITLGEKEKTVFNINKKIRNFDHF